jgi:hypothetical protein
MMNFGFIIRFPSVEKRPPSLDLWAVWLADRV